MFAATSLPAWASPALTSSRQLSQVPCFHYQLRKASRLAQALLAHACGARSTMTRMLLVCFPHPKAWPTQTYISSHDDDTAFSYTRPKKRQRVSSSAAGARVVPPGPQLEPATNWAGGTYGGITSGADLVFRVAIKPVSTIGRPQATSDYGGATRTLEARGRHDACVLPRAPPLVEGMAALVLADAAMLQLSRTAAASEYTVPDTVTRASSSSPPPPSNKQT